jgi:hypothetical protein
MLKWGRAGWLAASKCLRLEVSECGIYVRFCSGGCVRSKLIVPHVRQLRYKLHSHAPTQSCARWMIPWVIISCLRPISRRKASVSSSTGPGIGAFDCISHVPRVLGYKLTRESTIPRLTPETHQVGSAGDARSCGWALYYWLHRLPCASNDKSVST